MVNVTIAELVSEDNSAGVLLGECDIWLGNNSKNKLYY